MKNNIVNKFIENSQNNNKIALIYKNKKISYDNLLKDIFKMINLFKSYNLKPNDKVLLFIIPSYNFYLCMLASIYYGLNIIVIDSFSDKKKVFNLVNMVDVKLCFVDNKSRFLKFILPKLKFINISRYFKNDNKYIEYKNNDNTVLTTFTSGTTGNHKIINRKISDLEKQIKLLNDNINFNESNTILCGLPIYMLLLLVLGKTAIIDNKINKKLDYDTILMPIIKVLKNKKRMNNIKYMFLGGAILYQNEVNKIKDLYPNAYINYVYGASEGVLIAKTSLDDYHDLSFDNNIIGVDVKIVDDEIVISGDAILTASRHYTGDLGCIEGSKLKVLGRKKYSNGEFYNYVFDEVLLNENPGIKKGFSFWYNDNIYFVYEGSLSKKRDNVIYYKFKKLPMDSKHKTKLDYNMVMKVIK